MEEAVSREGPRDGVGDARDGLANGKGARHGTRGGRAGITGGVCERPEGWEQW